MEKAQMEQSLMAYLYGQNLTQICKKGILYIFYTDKYFYRPGEMLIMNLMKINLNSKDFIFTYPTSQYYDFLVKLDKKKIWEWSEGKSFLQVLSHKVLAPGEVYQIQEEWQIPLTLESGIYRVEGRNMATPPITLWVNIEVI